MSIHELVVAVKKQTGKSPEEFSVLAKAQNFATHNVIVDWLKSEFELSHGHATSITHLILETHPDKATDPKALTARFKGREADWIAGCRELFVKIKHFGPDVLIDLDADPIILMRGSAVFGLINVTAGKLEIGIQLPEAPFDSVFTEALDWDGIVSHKVTIVVQQQINDELIGWLRQAYSRSL